MDGTGNARLLTVERAVLAHAGFALAFHDAFAAFVGRRRRRGRPVAAVHTRRAPLQRRQSSFRLERAENIDDAEALQIGSFVGVLNITQILHHTHNATKSGLHWIRFGKRDIGLFRICSFRNQVAVKPMIPA